MAGVGDGLYLEEDDVALKMTREEKKAHALAQALATPLDASNKGYQMLARLGYRAGTGLGKYAHTPHPSFAVSCGYHVVVAIV